MRWKKCIHDTYTHDLWSCDVYLWSMISISSVEEQYVLLLLLPWKVWFVGICSGWRRLRYFDLEEHQIENRTLANTQKLGYQWKVIHGLKPTAFVPDEFEDSSCTFALDPKFGSSTLHSLFHQVIRSYNNIIYFASRARRIYIERKIHWWPLKPVGKKVSQRPGI